MTDDDLILAFDIGTSSIRTGLFDRHAVAIDSTLASRPCSLTTDRDGRAELDPNALLEAARQCLEETLNKVSRPVVAVGASSLWHSLAGLDAHGNAITSVLTWADSRGSEDLDAIREQLQDIGMHQRTGCMPHASFWPAKLLYLKRSSPEVFAAVKRWVSPAEYIFLKLAGIDVTAPGMATATGIYDPTKRCFDPEMMAICGIEAHTLPAIDATGQDPDAALLNQQGLGVLAQASWYAAIGDGAASNLGSGGDRNGVAAINLGTSGAVRLMDAGTEVNVPHGLFGYRVDDHRYLVGGAVSNLASLLQWCWRELALDDDLDAFELALADRQTPEHGLTVLPFWLNERAPRWRDDLTGCILGLRQATTGLDIAQAMLESAYHRLATITESLAASRPVDSLVVSGGLAVSRNGMQRLANVLGRPLDVCSIHDASIRGAAAYVLHQRGETIESPPVRWHIVPDNAAARAFAEDRMRHLELETKLFGHY